MQILTKTAKVGGAEWGEYWKGNCHRIKSTPFFITGVFFYIITYICIWKNIICNVPQCGFNFNHKLCNTVLFPLKWHFNFFGVPLPCCVSPWQTRTHKGPQADLWLVVIAACGPQMFLTHPLLQRSLLWQALRSITVGRPHSSLHRPRLVTRSYPRRTDTQIRPD